MQAAKGWVVHPLKSHMSWVQYVARQYGSISWKRCHLKGSVSEYERNGDAAPLVDRLSLMALPGSYAPIDKT